MDSAYDPNPVPSDSDRFWFNLCRTMFGSLVLGMTGMFAIFTVQPLFMERALAQDSQAARSILLISGGPALLLGACAVLYMRQRRRHEADAAVDAASQERRRAKRTKNPRRRDAADTPSEGADPLSLYDRAPNPNEMHRVTLVKPTTDAKLGIRLAGEERPRIISLNPEGLAAKAGCLSVGDVFLKVRALLMNAHARRPSRRKAAISAPQPLA